jgi:molybdate transport system substrate-binding protein
MDDALLASVYNWHFPPSRVNEGRTGAAPMKIHCTNGVKSVMLDLVPQLERQCGTRLTVVWGATNTIIKEFETGGDGDVAILTAEAIDQFITAGKATPGSRVDLARSAIGIAARKGAKKPDIGSTDALKRALLSARTVAHSKSGLSGIYFPTVLSRLGIADAMKSKIVIPDPGTPVGEVVARGEAELGIQQISELLPVPGIEIVGPLPADLQKVTTFSAGVLSSARDPDAAKSLVELLAAGFPPLLKRKGLEPA